MITTAVEAPDRVELAQIIRSYTDVTERLKRSHELLRREVCRLRDELQEKNKELERKERLAALGEMAAGVAHEIRNPLGGIGLYASLLERDLTDRPELRRTARNINAGVRRMERVVGDILAFAGDRVVQSRASCLGDMVQSVLTQARPPIEELGTIVETSDTVGEIVLECDGAQVERALLNLLLNAVDAAGAQGRVWISAIDDVEHGVVRIKVEDDGPGVEFEHAERVFHPFFTTKAKGTGLGLAIVHRIVESHGGSVSVDRRETGGASFTLTLPSMRERNGIKEMERGT